MKRMTFFLLILFLCAGIAPQDLASAEWPIMTGATDQHECKEAFTIARAMFRSNTSTLYAPPAIPAGFPDTLVLRIENLDISGGKALVTDEKTFDELPIPAEGAPRSFYWQKATKDGFRIVIREESHGWRGDTYYLYSIGEKITPTAFLAAIMGDKEDSKFVPIISDAWRPPLIFRNKKSGNLWFIGVGQPHEFLGDWRVYRSGSRSATALCTIRFRPTVNSAEKLLPMPVQQLALLLNGTVGKEGVMEGTLQPTTRLRIQVQATWANVALRPWASAEPYNTRREVDDGLRQWSRNGRSYLKLYKQIYRQYPEAEQSLAQYYRRKFHLSAEKAKAQAAYSLDVAFRSHYVFHTENELAPDRASKNPWPRGPFGRNP